MVTSWRVDGSGVVTLINQSSQTNPSPHNERWPRASRQLPATTCPYCKARGIRRMAKHLRKMHAAEVLAESLRVEAAGGARVDWNHGGVLSHVGDKTGAGQTGEIGLG